MPAKDIFHDCVKQALIKDGWTITDDPLSLKVGKKDIFIDLAAEKILIAEKREKKISIEVKSFIGTSEVEDLKNALGQYILYEKILKHQLSKYILYLPIRQATFNRLFTEENCQVLRQILTPYINIYYANADIHNRAAFDQENNQYFINNKVWIQCDNTEDGIANESVTAGIPKQDIVLGFHEPEIRKYTGFAVA